MNKGVMALAAAAMIGGCSPESHQCDLGGTDQIDHALDEVATTLARGALVEPKSTDSFFGATDRPDRVATHVGVFDGLRAQCAELTKMVENEVTHVVACAVGPINDAGKATGVLVENTLRSRGIFLVGPDGAVSIDMDSAGCTEVCTATCRSIISDAEVLIQDLIRRHSPPPR